MANESWLDGICEFTGPEADLPLGGYSKIPGWYPEKVAKSWVVMDAESDEGTAIRKTSELKKDDIIIGVNLNPKTLAAIYRTYGPEFYKIKAANGGPWLTPDEWQTDHGTNGLGLVAMRNMRRKLTGGGVQF
jgi:hypothetical protein